MRRCRCKRGDLRTLRGTTVQVCLACDWADPEHGPRLEFEPVPWPPRATERRER